MINVRIDSGADCVRVLDEALEQRAQCVMVFDYYSLNTLSSLREKLAHSLAVDDRFVHLTHDEKDLYECLINRMG